MLKTLHGHSFVFFLWRAQTLFLSTIPIGELVGTSIGTTEIDVCLSTARHVIDEGTEVADNRLWEVDFSGSEQICPASAVVLSALRHTRPVAPIKELSGRRLDAAIAVK